MPPLGAGPGSMNSTDLGQKKVSIVPITNHSIELLGIRCVTSGRATHIAKKSHPPLADHQAQPPRNCKSTSK